MGRKDDEAEVCFLRAMRGALGSGLNQLELGFKINDPIVSRFRQEFDMIKFQVYIYFWVVNMKFLFKKNMWT